MSGEIVGAVVMGLLGLFALSIFWPVPWLLLGAWLEESAKTKRILAQARLQEAKNEARHAARGADGGEA